MHFQCVYNIFRTCQPGSPLSILVVGVILFQHTFGQIQKAVRYGVLNCGRRDNCQGEKTVHQAKVYAKGEKALRHLAWRKGM